MKKHMYPDDGGLKPQVRPLNEGFNVFKMIKEHFKNRKVGQPDNR